MFPPGLKEGGGGGGVLSTFKLLMAWAHTLLAYTTAVEPSNKGHFGANSFVPCREVVPISDVK